MAASPLLDTPPHREGLGSAYLLVIERLIPSFEPHRPEEESRVIGRSAALQALIVTVALSSQARALSAQSDTRPVTPAHRLSGPVTLDGRLDESAWAETNPIVNFVQREPIEGQPVSERTEVRILTDGQALYIGASLFDSDAGAISLGERIRDADLERGDYFGIILDTYRDRQNGFIFSTTPAGIEYDAQVVKEGQGGGVFQRGQNRQQAGAMGGLNVNWDGSWEVATTRDENGWYVEMRIPFSTLRYGAGPTQTWGMNLVRRIRRKNEEALWAPVPRQYDMMRLSVAGDLVGLEVPLQRSGTVTPYLLGAAERDYGATPLTTDYPGEAGFDAKLTFSSLTLDATVNTDFAQVEVDEQRTNLTRFPLFFPEKRPFFLENAGVFSAGTPQAADLFFSRRIGISPNGAPVPILGGARVSGKAAGMNVGLMQIFTDAVVGDVAENAFTVARVASELPNRSRVGAIFVQRRGTHDASDFNRTYGVDGRMGLGESWTLDGWAALTETSPTDREFGRESAYSLLTTYQSRTWSGRLRMMQVGEDFNPEVGFVNRVGYRHLEASVQRIFRFPNISWWRESNPHVTYQSFWDFNGLKESGFLHFDAEIQFEGGGRFGPELNVVQEGLAEPFEVSPGVFIPTGDYSSINNSWDFGSDPSKRFSLLGRAELGEFFTGNRYGGNVTFTARHGETLASSLLIDHNIVHLPQGDFEATLLGLRLGYFFNPNIFVQSLIQYSDQAQVWSANLRFAWLSTAGTGLYVVYNGAQRAARLSNWGEPIQRGLIIKYARQLSLF
jgi:hypothetical protein